jgi:hypothetical protein
MYWVIFLACWYTHNISLCIKGSAKKCRITSKELALALQQSVFSSSFLGALARQQAKVYILFSI